jgi:hypothetical protein
MTNAHALSRNDASASQPEAATSKTRLWVGRTLGTFAVLFLVMDGGMKLFKPPFVVEATLQLGYPESTIVGIGLALLLSTVLYVIPRTAVFGAILITGYLGGAVASNIRAGTPVFNVVFPIVVAAVVWASLVLRDQRLENILFKTR